jgi:hypothetical protein
MAYVSFVFQPWVEGDRVVVVVGTDTPVVRVAAGDETAGEGVALCMGAIAFERGMAASVTISAPTAELGVWENISDSKPFFEPGSLRFQLSSISVG